MAADNLQGGTRPGKIDSPNFTGGKMFHDNLNKAFLRSHPMGGVVKPMQEPGLNAAIKGDMKTLTSK